MCCQCRGDGKQSDSICTCTNYGYERGIIHEASPLHEAHPIRNLTKLKGDGDGDGDGMVLQLHSANGCAGKYGLKLKLPK